ncbi:hypothetical protein [Rhizobium laguerreae]|uniref:hypothetical protein n=1 Tax=Rhizobium laguerreae TaxID=1076926 RepID=UPI001FE46DD3|nr:hypothetical protein [Rhizobium laguerreae]
MYLGHTSPGKGKESNRLPTPDGKYSLVGRVYPVLKGYRADRARRRRSYRTYRFGGWHVLCRSRASSVANPN